MVGTVLGTVCGSLVHCVVTVSTFESKHSLQSKPSPSQTTKMFNNLPTSSHLCFADIHNNAAG